MGGDLLALWLLVAFVVWLVRLLFFVDAEFVDTVVVSLLWPWILALRLTRRAWEITRDTWRG